MRKISYVMAAFGDHRNRGTVNCKRRRNETGNDEARHDRRRPDVPAPPPPVYERAPVLSSPHDEKRYDEK
jgi:hypothetical protein